MTVDLTLVAATVRVALVRAAVLLLVLGGGACDTRKAMDPAVSFTLERVEADVAELVDGKDPTLPCAAIRRALEELAGERSAAVRDVLEPARTRCRDALLALAEELVARGGGRARAPVRPMVRECVDLDRALVLLEAIEPGSEPVLALRRRHQTLCP